MFAGRVLARWMFENTVEGKVADINSARTEFEKVNCVADYSIHYGTC